MAHQLADRIGRDGGVGVNGHDNFVVRLAQRARQRRGLSAIGLVQDAHARIVAEVRLEQFAGAVGRTVVHDDNFDVPDSRRPAPNAPCGQ